jgi:hypothetical protein
LSALSPRQYLTPLEGEMSVVTGYCGVDSAELGRVWTGDLGRCETDASIAVALPRQAPLRTCSAGSGLGLHQPLSVLT